jgi:pimeloyl-ACP methyl ester carboxylesterase
VSIERFRIAVPDDDLEDLAARLAATRYAPGTPGGWARGFPPSVLRELVDSWRTGYDWRAEEARLNAYDQFTVAIGAVTVHFVHRRADRRGRLPLVLSHGWPYTFNEMLPLVDALAGELDVVVPSLPGYVFSSALDTPWSDRTVAELWHTLMTDVLGYDRYLTYGEDVGGGVSDWLAGLHPESVAGIIAPHPSFSARDRDGVVLTAQERSFFVWLKEEVKAGDDAYGAIQSTRPDTLAGALSDSPSGLLAWVAEKFHSWSDGGLAAFDVARILTPVMLYWVTNSVGTSFRPYAEPGHELHPPVTVPAAVIVQRHEHRYPRSLAEKSYLDVRSFHRLAQRRPLHRDRGTVRCGPDRRRACRLVRRDLRPGRRR